MAKLVLKYENLTPLSGEFSIKEQFDLSLSSCCHQYSVCDADYQVINTTR